MTSERPATTVRSSTMTVIAYLLTQAEDANVER
jgi:hypothetical protein